MVGRAVVVWCGLVALAVSNGAVREALLVPQVGAGTAHVISTITLCALVMWAAYMTIDWIAPTTVGDALGVGALWLVLVLAFEFLAGHFLFGHSWASLLAEYNLVRGRVWIFVPAVTLVAPWLAARARDLLLGGEAARPAAGV
jgi:hypothetical protein